ncbi:MAG: hypothetical protein Q8N63_00255 [Nanoarchaeota archaeon]|nr:hypothetical protein [Nanoarchaeota archaeon]
MEKPKLSKEQEYEVYRGLLHLIQSDTYESKHLLSENKIDEAISRLNDVRNLLERASRLKYFPRDKISFLAARYNTVVLDPKIQEHPKKPYGFGLRIDEFEKTFTKEELDSVGDRLEGLLK